MSEKRYADTPENLIFYTDTDDSDYPIYITSKKEIWIKKKPEDVLAVFHVKVKKKEGFSMFSSEKDFEEKAAEFKLEINEILKTAAKAVLELGNADRDLYVFDLDYEVYAGDHERYVSTVKAVAVKIHATSAFRCMEKQAWAISYEWEKRIKAKYPTIAKHVYAKAIIGRRNYARVIVKVPFPTKEFEEIFSRVLTVAAAQVSPTSELETQVKQLEELIRQKQHELQVLQEQLQQLQLKLQLEQMKRQVL